MADEGAKCSAQVLPGEGGLRGNKKGIEDARLELCLLCCAARTPQVPFASGAKGERFDDIDGRSGSEFSLARIKDFMGVLLWVPRRCVVCVYVELPHPLP